MVALPWELDLEKNSLSAVLMVPEILQKTTFFSGQDGFWLTGSYILTGRTSIANTLVSVSHSQVLLHQKKPQALPSVVSGSQHIPIKNGSIEPFQDASPTNPKNQDGHRKVTIIAN